MNTCTHTLTHSFLNWLTVCCFVFVCGFFSFLPWSIGNIFRQVLWWFLVALYEKSNTHFLPFSLCSFYHWGWKNIRFLIFFCKKRVVMWYRSWCIIGNLLEWLLGKLLLSRLKGLNQYHRHHFLPLFFFLECVYDNSCSWSRGVGQGISEILVSIYLSYSTNVSRNL